MPRLSFTLLLLFLALALPQAMAQSPTAEPTMTYVTTDGTETTDTQYDGSAPLAVTFRANPSDLGDYTPRYEWRFTRNGEAEPFLTRYEEDTQYTFSESGSFSVALYVSFIQGTDTLTYEMDSPFSLTFAESKLEVPNAFTPNGDGINDVFRVKEGYQSIVTFRAQVFDRWGKRLAEWTDLDGGWDGRSGGHDAPDGAYYLRIEARGADGKQYHIKKVINLLRAFTESSGTTQ